MAKTDICIILSRYGECEFLDEQIQSLRDQTMDAAVLIRRDDGADHAGIKGSLRILLSQVPISCSYVCFCDQDDVWFPRKLETLYNAMKDEEKRYTGPLLIHVDSFITDRDLSIVKRRFVSKWARHGDFFGSLMFNKVQGASMMINRLLFDRVRDLPDDGPAYDRYIHLMAEIYGKRVFIDRPLMYYRQHSNNAIGAFSRGRKGGFIFIEEQEKDLFSGNMYIMSRHHCDVDRAKKDAFRDYQRLFASRNPLTRLSIIYRYLWRYPGNLAKKTLKICLP